MHATPKYRRTSWLLAGALLALASVARAPAAPFPPLNAAPTGNQIPGKLVWADLFTSSPDQASKFYCGLFGWTASKIDQKGGEYTIFSNQGQPVAGLAPHTAGKEGMTSRWIGYVSVADLKATVALAEQNGGVVHGKIRRFPDRGQQAIIADAEGVPLGLLQSSSGDSPDEDTPVGGWNWFEIYARDPKNASNFFHTVLGYSADPEKQSGRNSEFVLSSASNNRGGIAPLPDGEDIHATWLGVIRVADIDQTLAKVPGLGGSVLVSPHAVEFGSRFAIVGDPTGGSIGLVQYADNSNPASSP
jgi:predicted enzyme related to lactoylglutathione lyase